MLREVLGDGRGTFIVVAAESWKEVSRRLGPTSIPTILPATAAKLRALPW